MAVDTAPELRFGVANEGLTSQADLAKHLGLAEVLARSMRPKQRRRGNRDAQMLLSLIYSQCVCEGISASWMPCAQTGRRPRCSSLARPPERASPASGVGRDWRARAHRAALGCAH